MAGGAPWSAAAREPDLPVLRWSRPLAAALAVSLLITGLSFVLPVVLGLSWDDWQHRARSWFDVGNEGNLPTWWNTALLVASAALCAAVSAMHRFTGGRRWAAWASLALITGLLSLDEASGLHERLRHLADLVIPDHGFTFAWLVVGIPLALAVLVIAALLARRLVRPARRLFLGGLLVLLAGAVGLETTNDLLVRAQGGEIPEGGTLLFHVVYHLEELLELVGASLMLAAPLAALRNGTLSGRFCVVTR